MRKIVLYVITALLLTSVLFTGCSNDKSSDSEKGAVKTFTDEVAKEAVGRIKAPIEKAQAVKDKQEGDFSSMEKSLKE